MGRVGRSEGGAGKEGRSEGGVGEEDGSEGQEGVWGKRADQKVTRGCGEEGEVRRSKGQKGVMGKEGGSEDQRHRKVREAVLKTLQNSRSEAQNLTIQIGRSKYLIPLGSLWVLGDQKCCETYSNQEEKIDDALRSITSGSDAFYGAWHQCQCR